MKPDWNDGAVQRLAALKDDQALVDKNFTKGHSSAWATSCTSLARGHAGHLPDRRRDRHVGRPDRRRRAHQRLDGARVEVQGHLLALFAGAPGR
jgi:hypothetical protein